LNSDRSNYCHAYIGLGSNLGDRVQNIIDARRHLLELTFVQSLQSSSLYLSSPVGYFDQADFINCVVSLTVACDAATLFEEMQKIELFLARVRDARNQNAPRTIDLDLLMFGDLQNADPRLTIPHPRMAERLFVLQPLSELAPNLEIPNLGGIDKIVAEGLTQGRFAGQDLFKLGV